MNHLFFKSLNPNRRRLRVAGDDYMDAVGETLSTKCYSPRRLVARLLGALRLTKHHRHSVVQRRTQNDATDLETPSFPLNGPNHSEDSGQLHRNDTSFKLGVACGLLYMIAANKNELGKVVELRKEMEMLLQHVKGELQSKDALLKPLKQSDALACSITDIQEVSSSNSHPSFHSKTPYVQPESKSNMVYNRFLEYDTSEQDECAEEINELQAEFEVELERLQLYLEREAALEDPEQERVKFHSRMDENGNWLVTVEDSRSKSHSEIVMDPQEASADVSFGVPPVELERRLHELLEARLQERITELESALECTTQQLIEKQTEVTWWKDTAGLISQHVPEISRFAFRLDPETNLKLSQVV